MDYRHLRQLGSLALIGLVFSGCMALQHSGSQTETAPAAKAAPAESAGDADQEIIVIDVPNEAEEAATEAPEPVALPMAPKPAPEPKPVVKAKPAPAAEPEPEIEPEPEVEPEPAVAAAPAPSAATPFDHYQVTVSADESSVAVGQPVSLRVYVDAPDYPLSGYEAHGVQITFSGLGFTADAPAVECLRAHPNGSEIIYNMTAVNPGSYDVVANVAVYPTRDCQNSSVKKRSAPVTIRVK